jgi:SAM-dependent methyltransferase
MPSLVELLDEAESRPLIGWDISYDGRLRFTPPWDFEAMVDALIGKSPDLLDMGTGGGEWLSRRPFPQGRTMATEAWPPNIPIARQRLAPLGASVIAVAGAPDNVDQAAAPTLPSLPFADESFRLVTNRHESFVSAEVARVLAPGGGFITQQVGSDMGAPFRALLGAPSAPARTIWRLSLALDQVRASGLQVTDCGEAAAQLAFDDVGALAWYLLHVPWVMPEFSIAAYGRRLAELHERSIPSVPQPMFRLAAGKRS